MIAQQCYVILILSSTNGGEELEMQSLSPKMNGALEHACLMNLLRGYKGWGISGFAARWYDANFRGHRRDKLRTYAQEAGKHAPDGGVVLEAAPGPGYLSIEMAKLGSYKIYGLDISEGFLNIARTNAKEAGVNIDFRQGNVSAMSFSDARFDFIICTDAFKDFKNPLAAVNEMYGVLKPGAAALIIDLNRNVSDEHLKVFVEQMNVKGDAALFMKLTRKYFLRKGAYSKDGFVNILAGSNFIRFKIKEAGVSLTVCLYKQMRPAADRRAALCNCPAENRHLIASQLSIDKIKTWKTN